MDKLLENDIVLLRALEPEDLDLLYTWENDTRLWQYGATIAPLSRFALREYLADSRKDIYQTGQLRLMIVCRETNARAGIVDLYDFDPFHGRAAIGILIDETFQHRGYGQKALELIEAYAFAFLKLHQVYSFVPETNTSSINLFQKAGFTFSAKIDEWISVGDTFHDVFVMQKINKKTAP